MRKMSTLLKCVVIILATIASAHGQMYFGAGGATTFVYGGGLPNNPFTGPYVTDIYMELRASSGATNSDGSGFVNWVLNDSQTVTVQGLDYGSGNNWPFVVLKGYDDYGNWSYIIIELGDWWPNDGGAHSMKFQLLQAGYDGVYRKDVNVTMDDRMLPARITKDIPTTLHVALNNGGNFMLGFGSVVGVSRFLATEGVYPNPYSAPIYVVGGDLTLNLGWGYDLNFFPDVTYEIDFGDSCPGC
jgi:hypothetical protein